MSFPHVRAAKGIKATPFMKFMWWAAGSKILTSKRECTSQHASLVYTSSHVRVADDTAVSA